MKILILCNHLNIGGITNYVLLLAKGLTRYGHKVWVAGEGILVEEFKKQNIEIIPLNLKIKSELNPRIFLCISKLKKYFLKEKPDIIHANTRTTSIIAYFLAKSFKIPYITTCHGLYKFRLARRLFPFTGGFVIAISKEVKNQLIRGLRIDPQKVKLIYNGIDLDYFSPEKINTTKKDFGFKEEDFIIGNIARFVREKGQDILISSMPKIIEKIPQAKLLLIGEGRNETFLKEMVKKLSLKDRVFFLGSLKDTRSILKIMDVFCFLPSYEGFGLALLEAMAMGVPIIASNVSEIPYILDYGKAGILIEPEEQNLVSAILYLYRNPEKKKELSEYAYKRVKDFSYLRMVEETISLYNLALKNE